MVLLEFFVGLGRRQGMPCLYNGLGAGQIIGIQSVLPWRDFTECLNNGLRGFAQPVQPGGDYTDKIWGILGSCGWGVWDLGNYCAPAGPHLALFLFVR